MALQPGKIQGIQFHPLLESLYDEMHSRPYQVIPSPARITHFVVLTEDSQRAAQFTHLQSLYLSLGQTPPPTDNGHIQLDLGAMRIRRETHLEFTAYTFVNFAVSDEAPFDLTGLSILPEGWLESLPGMVVANFHLALQRVSTEGASFLAEAKESFEGQRLVGSSPQQGNARLWTSFRLHSDGYGRFLIGNHQMSDSQLGRLTQRLIEIETYRLMTLLALPLAREKAPQLAQMETQLTELTHQLACDKDRSEESILLALTDMAAQVEAMRAKTAFRFTATFAYYELVLKRLEELREDEVSGHLTLTEFITRRLTPAVNTCRAVSDRLESLSLRIDRVSDLIRTKVELAIQGQNQQLLTSMDRRSKIQLMMQHTVEGLSVAAISYYSVGLVKYLLEAAPYLPISKNIAVGIAVPVVITTVWLATRRVHKKFHKLAKEQRQLDDH